jgi:hypothetical protein
MQALGYSYSAGCAWCCRPPGIRRQRAGGRRGRSVAGRSRTTASRPASRCCAWPARSLGELQLKLMEAASKPLAQETLQREKQLVRRRHRSRAARAGSRSPPPPRSRPASDHARRPAPGRPGCNASHQARGRRRRNAGCAVLRARSSGIVVKLTHQAWPARPPADALVRIADTASCGWTFRCRWTARRKSPRSRGGHRGRSWRPDGHAAGPGRHGQRQPDRDAARAGHARGAAAAPGRVRAGAPSALC